MEVLEEKLLRDVLMLDYEAVDACLKNVKNPNILLVRNKELDNLLICPSDCKVCKWEFVMLYDVIQMMLDAYSDAEIGESVRRMDKLFRSYFPRKPRKYYYYLSYISFFNCARKDRISIKRREQMLSAGFSNEDCDLINAVFRSDERRLVQLLRSGANPYLPFTKKNRSIFDMLSSSRIEEGSLSELLEFYEMSHNESYLVKALFFLAKKGSRGRMLKIVMSNIREDVLLYRKVTGKCS